MNNSSLNIKNQLEISKSRLSRSFARLEGGIDKILFNQLKISPSKLLNEDLLDNSLLIDEITQLKIDLARTEKDNAELNSNLQELQVKYDELKEVSAMLVEEMNDSIAELLTLGDNRNANN